MKEYQVSQLFYPLFGYFYHWMHRVFWNFRSSLVLIINSLFNKLLIVLSVVALLAEHSFWFSGGYIEQLHYAIKSFKSQKNIKLVQAEVETAFRNATNKEDSAWLIQLVIDNKLVCNIILHLLFKILTTSSEAQVVFLKNKS